MASIGKSTGYALVVTMMLCASSQAQGVYTSNPLVEWLARQAFELRLDVQIDTADNLHDRAGVLAGFGWGLTEALTLGAYGSLRGSDRDLPAKAEVIRGGGLYGEYGFAPGARIEPLVGLRLGILAPTGPRAPTSMHAAGSVGARIALTDHTFLVFTATANWTEEELYNYKRADNAKGYTADTTDFSMDIGLRYRF